MGKKHVYNPFQMSANSEWCRECGLPELHPVHLSAKDCPNNCSNGWIRVAIKVGAGEYEEDHIRCPLHGDHHGEGE